jgi:DNA replication protein DnaC
MSLTPPMSPRVVDARLQGLLKQLRLPTVAKNYETLARQAAESGQPYPEYLMALLERELSQRDVNRRRRLLRQARFPITYSLDTYDFTLMPSLSKPKVLELASGDFISKAQNVVLLGQIGTGKTHVATALGYAACESGYKVRFFTAAALISQLLEAHQQNQLSRLENSLLKQHLIIIDELGFVPFSQQGAQMLFTFISQRYQRASLLITTNLPFTEWTQVFQDTRLLGALLDRLTHHCHILEFRGESHRFRHSQAQHATNLPPPISRQLADELPDVAPEEVTTMP